MRKFLPCLLIGLYLFSVGLISCARNIHISEVRLPDIEPFRLDPYAKLSFYSIKESSGLAKSRLYKDVYWTHNDSGDSARIFAVTRKGNIIKPDRVSEYNGITVQNAINIDWEDIAADSNGNLIVGDFGNNLNTRRDLSIYIIKEPDPSQDLFTKVSLKVSFYYPDQKIFPPKKMNYDAEALFWAKDKIYLLTKHRSNPYTKLYRFDSMDPLKQNPLTYIGSFDSDGQVTGAVASKDGNRLAVLTYRAVWLFEIDNSTDNYFHGKIFWLPIIAGQCEGIAIDGNKLLISNEQRALFEVPIDRLIVVKE